MAWLGAKAREMGAGCSIALAVALAWSGALVIGAITIPVYSTSGSSGSGSDTLVGANGTAVIGVVMLPLLIVVVVAAALMRRHLPAAWAVVGLLAVFNLLAMLSIGIFVLPVTLCLLVACTRSRSAVARGAAVLPSR